MYPKWMRALLLYFDLWGFFTQFNQSQRFDRLIFVLHIILASVTTFVFVQFLSRTFGDKLGTINDHIKYCAILVVYWLSLLELFSKRKAHRRFWISLENIDKQFCCHQNLRFRTYILKISLYFTLFVLMYVNYFNVLFSKGNSDLYYFWFCYTYIGLYLKSQFFCYLLHLEFVINELKIIDREVNDMLDAYGNGHRKTRKVFLRRFHRNRFKWIRKFYETIYDMCDSINGVFGWSNAAIVLFSFLLMVTEFNWFYWKMYNQFQNDAVGEDTGPLWHICKF